MSHEEKIKTLSEVFTPTFPVANRNLFYGRLEQLKKVHDAINSKGQHAILYGDRGVGKTSLANIATLVYPDVIVSKVTCNRTEDFKSLWTKAFSKISFQQETQGIGFKASPNFQSVQLELFLQKKKIIDSKNIESVLQNLSDKLLIIFDEFDSIKSEETKIRMADTIKALADNVPNVTILIVGIAESVGALIGSHPSLERCLLQIKMPRMSSNELDEIITNGMSRLSLKIDNNLKSKIIDYSSGFPSYTHLLCRFAALSAINENTEFITYSHFSTAVTNSLENANQSLRDSYHKATMFQKGAINFSDIIYACALAKSDELNCFSPNEILYEYNGLTKKKHRIQQITYHINQLLTEERGSIIEKIGTPYKAKLRFSNPMMKSFVRLKFHLRSVA